jgi:hypothetical protein
MKSGNGRGSLPGFAPLGLGMTAFPSGYCPFDFSEAAHLAKKEDLPGTLDRSEFFSTVNTESLRPGMRLFL